MGGEFRVVVRGEGGAGVESPRTHGRTDTHTPGAGAGAHVRPSPWAGGPGQGSGRAAASPPNIARAPRPPAAQTELLIPGTARPPAAAASWPETSPRGPPDGWASARAGRRGRAVGCEGARWLPGVLGGTAGVGGLVQARGTLGAGGPRGMGKGLRGAGLAEDPSPTRAQAPGRLGGSLPRPARRASGPHLPAAAGR